MEEFFKLYDEIREQYPLYLVIKQIKRTRWRIEVYGKHMAENGSDASIITSEHDSRGQCFIDAKKLLEGSRDRLEVLSSNHPLLNQFKHHF